MTTTTYTPAPRTARQIAALQMFANGEHWSTVKYRLGVFDAHAVARSARRTLARQAAKVRFGVEVEFTGISREVAAEAIKAAGHDARVEGYNHTTRKHVKIIGDASVTGSSRNNGGEAVLPPVAGEAGLAMVADVLDALRGAGARVDRSCGLHVHIDTKGLTGEGVARFAEAMYAAQPMLRAFVTASRAQQYYCSPTRRSTVSRFSAAVRGGYFSRDASESSERYAAVNVLAYGRHGTIECRLHGGSLNAAKVSAWIKMLLAIRSTVEAETDGALIDAVRRGASTDLDSWAMSANVTVPVEAPLAALVKFGGLDPEVADRLTRQGGAQRPGVDVVAVGDRPAGARRAVRPRLRRGRSVRPLVPSD